MCTTRQIFNIPCPTCGVGRSLHALLHGDIPESLRYHPLTIPLLLAGGLWWALSYRRALSGAPPLPAWLMWAVLGAAVTSVMVVYAIRLSAGTIP